MEFETADLNVTCWRLPPRTLFVLWDMGLPRWIKTFTMSVTLPRMIRHCVWLVILIVLKFLAPLNLKKAQLKSRRNLMENIKLVAASSIPNELSCTQPTWPQSKVWKNCGGRGRMRNEPLTRIKARFRFPHGYLPAHSSARKPLSLSLH